MRTAIIYYLTAFGLRKLLNRIVASGLPWLLWLYLASIMHECGWVMFKGHLLT